MWGYYDHNNNYNDNYDYNNNYDNYNNHNEKDCHNETDNDCNQFDCNNNCEINFKWTW